MKNEYANLLKRDLLEFFDTCEEYDKIYINDRLVDEYDILNFAKMILEDNINWYYNFDDENETCKIDYYFVK